MVVIAPSTSPELVLARHLFRAVEARDVSGQGERAWGVTGASGGPVAKKADEGTEGCETAGCDADACFDIGPDGDLVGIICGRLITLS